MSAEQTLLIMLPGAYDSPADLNDNGFGRLAEATGLRWQPHETDLSAVADGSLVHRVYNEAIAPARDAGVTRIVLGGISIGALMALACADSYPNSVDGLLLIAPYPGNRQIEATIAAQGGLMSWTPGRLRDVDGELRGWRALRNSAINGVPTTWLGYGADDRFAKGQAMMAAGLPDKQVYRVEGGHDWPTWQILFQQILAKGAIDG